MRYHTFDTHELVKSFVKSGIKETQAEVIIRAISSSRDSDMSHLATRSDIAEVRTEIAEVRTEIAESHLATKSEIAEVRTEIAEVRTEIAESHLATKSEIAESHLATRSEIAEVKTELKEDIAEVRLEIHKAKNQLLTWFISIMIGTAVTYLGTLAWLAFWFFEHYVVK